MSDPQSIVIQIRQSSRRIVIFATLFFILFSGLFAAFTSFIQAKQLGKLIENLSTRIVNNAIANQDLLSIQSEITRVGESIKESLGSYLYAEIYVDDRLSAQMGAQSKIAVLTHSNFVSKSNLLNGSFLEIRVFPDYEKALNNWIWSIFFIFLAGIILTTIFERLLSSLFKHWVNPLVITVDDINEIARSIERKDGRRIQNKKTNIVEIFQLESAVNKLLEAIEFSQIETDAAYEKLIEHEKEAAIGRITAHLSHDLRAPLGIFERLIRAPDESLPSMRGAVKDSLHRLNSMIESLRHSEVENLIHRSNSEIDFIYGTESLQSKALEYSVTFSTPNRGMNDLWVDSLKVERAWINLASNAIEAAHSFVKVEAERQGTSLSIRIIDDGPGVPPDILPKLFQRGVTHGKAGGTGLGLAYVRQIMQGHGGDVTYRRENGLSIFECILPDAFDRDEGQALSNITSPGLPRKPWHQKQSPSN